MRYRNLGNTGLRVSTVGLGSWLIFDDGDQARAERIHRAAYEAGINFYDTANSYGAGAAEATVGRALAPLRRDTVVIATKVFWPVGTGPFPESNDRGLGRKHVFDQCHASLRRIDTDYIDLYQCHRFDPTVPLAETCRAMNDLIVQGKVLYWGFSHWTPPQFARAVALCHERGWHVPVSSQPQYSLLSRHAEDTFASCARLGIGIVCFSPLAEGVLTGKYAEDVPESSRGADARSGRGVHERLTPANEANLRRLAEIARDANLPLGQLALAWCLRRPELSSAIVGASSAAHVVENAGAADHALDAETIRRIDAVLGPLRPWWKSVLRTLREDA